MAVSSWLSRTPSHCHTLGKPRVYALLALTSSYGGSRRPGLLTSEHPSLLGLCHCLSADNPMCVHSQMSQAHPSTPCNQASCTFRSRGFSPPQRFAPHTICRFVAPCYRSEVRLVSFSAPQLRRPKTTRQRPAALPEPQHHTPRRIPLICSRAASPRPFAFLLFSLAITLISSPK